MKSKGQATIFIIIAVIIVAAIGIFLFISRDSTVTRTDEFDVQAFLSQCVRNAVAQETDVMFPQGGFLNPTDFTLVNDTRVTYLCKNVNYYQPCINQHPRLITELQVELKGAIQDDVDSCIVALEDTLREQNYELTSGNMTETNIELKPGIVEVTIVHQIGLKKNEASRNFDSFEIAVRNPLYDLGYVAQEIVRQEAQFCYFENLGYSLLYRDFDIRKDSRDSTKIYTIKHLPLNKEMKIAIKGCVIPAGF